MPMFDFKCDDCKQKREHFIYPDAAIEKKCPLCASANYRRQFGRFKGSVEYSDTDEHIKKVINPGVDELYAQIGRESADEDTRTLENVFGSEVITESIVESD